MPKPVFYRLPVIERPIVSGITVTGRSALAISLSLVASRRPWPTYQTHGRRRPPPPPPRNLPFVTLPLSPVAARLLSVDRLLLHGGRGPHTRRTDTAKQRTVAYLSGRGRGNRCFCRRELITIVTPLSRPISAKTAASVDLCSVYKR